MFPPPPPSLLICLFSPTPSLLDSDDVFIIMDTKTRFVWKGTHSSEFAYDIAQVVQMNISFRFFLLSMFVHSRLQRACLRLHPRQSLHKRTWSLQHFGRFWAERKVFFFSFFSCSILSYFSSDHILHRVPPPGCPPERIKPRLFVYSKVRFNLFLCFD